MALNDVLERTHLGETCAAMIAFMGPVWVAFLVGLVIGWVWKPKWASCGIDKIVSGSSSSSVSESPHLSSPASSSSKPVVSLLKGSSSAPCLNLLKTKLPVSESLALDNVEEKKSKPSKEFNDCSLLHPNKEQSNVVTEEDLEYLWKLVENKDGGPPWIQMMDRSSQTMSYQAWRRDLKNGPPQYRTRTVFDNATPEVVRDFFWDDEFRPKWDDMLAFSTTIEECANTGTMIVQWIRKFPFFCSDREYIIGRRIWKSGRSYYCVTKGVPYDSLPRRDKPRRVDLYYSSWCIRAVESRGSGQLTACEVMLFHYEDMGIPWEIAKLGIRQGMWGTVKKIEPGLRAYQKERASGATLSRPAFMAQINTKIDPGYLRALEGAEDLSATEVAVKSDKDLFRNIPKLLIVGGAIAIACSLDQGFLPKALIFGVARRFANMGKKLNLERRD